MGRERLSMLLGTLDALSSIGRGKKYSSEMGERVYSTLRRLEAQARGATRQDIG